jgi:hypothetical protein
MPTRKMLQTGLLFGSSVVFGSTGLLVLLFGLMTELAAKKKEWSAQMFADTMAGVSLMYGLGIGMVVLAVVLGVVGWLTNRGSDSDRPAYSGATGRR